MMNKITPTPAQLAANTATANIAKIISVPAIAIAAVVLLANPGDTWSVVPAVIALIFNTWAILGSALDCKNNKVVTGNAVMIYPYMAGVSAVYSLAALGFALTMPYRS